MDVEDILQTYSAYATLKLNPYFAKAKVSYPPREVTFIAFETGKETGTMGQGQRRVPLHPRLMKSKRKRRGRPQIAPRRQAGTGRHLPHRGAESQQPLPLVDETKLP